MMRIRVWGTIRSSSPIIVILVLAILAAGCGGGATGEADDVAGTLTGDTTAGDAGDTTTTDASGDEPLPETLADFWGWDEDFDPAEEEAKARAQEMEVQEYIAECMANEGFQYTPWVPDEMFGYWEDPAADLTEEERILKYGYGYFTFMIEEQEAFEEGAFEGEWTPEDDPNWVYRESLSESEQAAYDLALDGNWENWEEPEPTYDDEGHEVWPEPDWSEIGGCRNLAYEEVWGGFGGPDPEMEALYEELWPKEEAMWERIQNDPRVVDANQAWSACMADAGYTFTTQEDIWMYLDELGQDLWADDEAFWRDLEQQAQALPEEEQEAFWEEATKDLGPWGPGVSEEEIQALADEELAIAAADWECRGDMNEIMEEVSKEYEKQFIAENIDLLRKVKAAQDELGW